MVIQMKKNVEFIITVMRKKRYFLISLVSSLLFLFLVYYFTNFQLMIGNLGYLHTIIYTVFSGTVVLLFGVYVGLFTYRWQERKTLSAQTFGIGAIGTGTSVLVNGCAACSITLASYLGLASVLSFLPFYGLELTVLGIVLLSFSIKKLSDEKPQTCSLNDNTMSGKNGK